ncbi:EEF1A lysine methyltransferase 2 [Eucyclogobius newberryi]|uniref:EEF1A lysine methyltransferase 2 n=1 Tax=Eucyclogobius newberryi TaxID=166745 RepID=UPI003B590000
MEDAAENAHGTSSNSSDTEEGICLDEELPSSKLGTKEYWDGAYEKELETFKDIGDVGEIWFGEESMTRVIEWMKKAKIPENASILDIGTGNGVFLVALADHGFKKLTGIDYSETSVELARNILLAEGQTDVTVKEVDFLSCQGELERFDVCIDKGTFDAISLNPDHAKEGKRLYVESLKSVLKDEGFFVITSCNWTKEQLLDRFKEGFELLEELPTPTFKFGGRTGSSVTALVFRRVQ